MIFQYLSYGPCHYLVTIMDEAIRNLQSLIRDLYQEKYAYPPLIYMRVLACQIYKFYYCLFLSEELTFHGIIKLTNCLTKHSHDLILWGKTKTKQKNRAKHTILTMLYLI